MIYRRVLIGIVYITLGEGCRGNTGIVGQGLDSLIKRGDISLVNRRGGSRSPGIGPGLWPPLARHSRPIIKRLLQASRNGN